MENVGKNINSHLTAKERNSISFPAKILLQQNLIKGKVLDFGCGFGSDVDFLSKRYIDIVGFDPYYFKEYPTEKYDTILCFYVLNVLHQEEQAGVLMQISNLLKPNGKAYFAVRRDLVSEGYRMHKIHQKLTYQCNVLLPFKSFFNNENCEIYEYQHYTILNKGNKVASPFFEIDEQRDLIFETATAFSIFDKFPVSKGHALVIPKRLVSNYFDLTFKEQSALWLMVNKIKSLFEINFNPNGYNIGININDSGGQTIPHVHIHIIPRYDGDVDEPRGGIRGVIPSKKNY
jgi:diadenosine tetraphosphate (Ap4A) HIT family hydrolase